LASAWLARRGKKKKLEVLFRTKSIPPTIGKMFIKKRYHPRFSNVEVGNGKAEDLGEEDDKEQGEDARSVSITEKVDSLQKPWTSELTLCVERGPHFPKLQKTGIFGQGGHSDMKKGGIEV